MSRRHEQRYGCQAVAQSLKEQEARDEAGVGLRGFIFLSVFSSNRAFTFFPLKVKFIKGCKRFENKYHPN